MEENIITKILLLGTFQIFLSDIDRIRESLITDYYKYLNSKKWSLKNYKIYIETNRINTNNTYNGSLYVAKWYERNLKIFSNIQQLSKECEKLFVIYGAGHLNILRDFINYSDDFEFVDVFDYL